MRSARSTRLSCARPAELVENGGIGIKGAEMVERAGLPGAMLRLASNEDQLRASALFSNEALNPAGEERRYIVALSLASTTPDWLSDIGGKPMALGLDLAGGVHFVLQVDMEEALAKRLGDELQKAKDVLREERIRYRSPDAAVTTGDINAFRLGFCHARAAATAPAGCSRPSSDSRTT